MAGTAITQVMDQATSLETATMRGTTILRGKKTGTTIMSGRKTGFTCPCLTGRTKAMNTTDANGKEQHQMANVNQARTSKDYPKALNNPQLESMMQAEELAEPQSILAEEEEAGKAM